MGKIKNHINEPKQPRKNAASLANTSNESVNEPTLSSRFPPIQMVKGEGEGEDNTQELGSDTEQQNEQDKDNTEESGTSTEQQVELGDLKLTPLPAEMVKWKKRKGKSKTAIINAQIAEYNATVSAATDNGKEEKVIDVTSSVGYGNARRNLSTINDTIDQWADKKGHEEERIRKMRDLKSRVQNQFVKLDDYVKNNRKKYEADEGRDVKAFNVENTKFLARLTHRHGIKEKKADDITKKKDGITDINTMRGKMVGIVKDMQRKGGTVKSSDGHIQADAGTNSFLEKLFEGGDGNSPEVQHGFANKILKPKYLNSISNGKLESNKALKKVSTGALSNYTAISNKNSKISQKRVHETEADTLIVQMFYNRMAELTKESKKTKTAKDKTSIKKEGKDLIESAVTRQNNVQRRYKAQDILNDDLEKEERIADILDRVKAGTSQAIKNGAMKAVSFGFYGYKRKTDARGMSKTSTIKRDGEAKTGVFNFTTGEEGELKADEVEGGYESSWPKSRMDKIFDKSKELTPALFNTGNYFPGVFTTMATVLSMVKELFTIAGEVTSTLSYMCAPLALLLPPVFVPVGMFLASLSLYNKFIMTGLSGLIASFHGLAQMANSNPALFNQLEGNSWESGLTFLAEAGSSAVVVGMGTSEWSGSGNDSGNSLSDRLTFDQAVDIDVDANTALTPTDKLKNSGTKDWSGTTHDYRSAKANYLLGEVGGSVAAEGGLGATTLLSESIESSEFSADYKGKKGNHKEKIDTKESELIRKSIAATRAKMKTETKSVYGYFVKIAKHEKQPVATEASGKVKQKAKDAQKFKNASARTSKNVAKGLN